MQDDDLAQELALRLVMSRYRSFAGARRDAVADTQLMPDRLPSHLPVDIPAIPGARIVGSTVWPEQTTILFHADAPAREIDDALTQGLAAGGWIHRPFGAADGGFPLVEEAGQSRKFYCHGATHVFLMVDTLTLPDGSTDIEMEITTDPDDTRCREDQDGRQTVPHDTAWYPPLPRFMPPPGAAQEGTNSGGGSYHARASGEVWSDLDLSSIHRHYARQLEATGWHPDEEGASESSAWSAWWREAEDGIRHQALLCAVRLAAGGSYLLHVYTARTAPPASSEPHAWVVWSG
jgi:hypothetical protein